MPYELYIRLVFFAGIFTFLAHLETRFPQRKLLRPKALRWRGNLSLVILNSLLLRVVFPTSAVAFALSLEGQPTLLAKLNLNSFSQVFLGVILLDLAIYIQHLLFHATPLLWRLHRTHHTDRDYDITTGTRFHPLEILLSMAIKFLVITAFGLPALSVLIFEILLNASSMFNHANLKLPKALDKGLRLLIVTPDMHRVHHSVYFEEHNSNFGFNLSIWDRLFGTYHAHPKDGQEAMDIGLDVFREEKEQQLGQLLTQPFRKSRS